MSDAAATTAEMTISLLAPWYGSKRTLAPRIVEEIGPHRGYCESKCGSLAVLFEKPRAPWGEIVNDKHGDLINLARVIASKRYLELQERVGRTLMSAAVYDDCKAIAFDEPLLVAPSIDDVEDAHIRRAWAFLTSAWLGINGVSGTGRGNVQMARRYTASGGWSPTRWLGVEYSIPPWHERLRGVLIDNIDAFELIDRIEDSDEWVLYEDPPYVNKGDTYVHDFPSIEEERKNPALKGHIALARSLRRFKKARVIVSYYDCPEVRELYDGWTFVDCSMNKALVNQGMRDKSRSGGEKVIAPEVLIINGPSFTEGGLFGGGK